jgi:hypothetical protein
MIIMVHNALFAAASKKHFSLRVEESGSYEKIKVIALSYTVADSVPPRILYQVRKPREVSYRLRYDRLWIV